MSQLKTTSAVLAGVAVLAMIVVQFVPWAHDKTTSSTPGFDMGSFGGTFPGITFTLETTVHTWQVVTEFNGESDTTSWYDDDVEGDGVGQVRAGIPILLAGAVVVLAGALLSAGRPSTAGPILTLMGGLLLAIGTTLFATGVETAFDELDPAWSASFYVAITACVLAVTGGVLGLVAGNAEETPAF